MSSYIKLPAWKIFLEKEVRETTSLNMVLERKPGTGSPTHYESQVLSDW